MEQKFYEIFRPGTYEVIMAGKPKVMSFSSSDVQEIADMYNQHKGTHQEAPITIDHEKSGPAFGWVDEVKFEEGLLKASFKEVIPEFEESVKKKMYKRISVEIQPSTKISGVDQPVNWLRAVSFLGAQSPVVKGLKPVEFSDSQDVEIIEFKEGSLETRIAELSEAVSGLKAELAEKDQKIVSFAELEAQKKAAEEKLQALYMTQRKDSYREYLLSKVAYGSLTQPQIDDCMAILEAMDDVQTFSEEESEIVKTFKKFIDGLPKIVEFAELATKEHAGEQSSQELKIAEFGESVDPESFDLLKKIKAIQKEKGCSFDEAMRLVSKT